MYRPPETKTPEQEIKEYQENNIPYLISPSGVFPLIERIGNEKRIQ
jgi:hypothetical protein